MGKAPRSPGIDSGLGGGRRFERLPTAHSRSRKAPSLGARGDDPTQPRRKEGGVGVSGRTMRRMTRNEARSRNSRTDSWLTSRAAALGREGFASLDRRVIVRRSSEVIEMAESRPAVVEQPTERAEAFLRLADDHLDAAYRLARAILRDATEAQDATHDAFEQAWRKWSTLRDPARFEPWFDRILVNTCRDRLRSAKRLPTDISAEVAVSSGDPYAQAHDRDVLANAIATLPPDHRIVVALRYYRDLPIETIATRLDIPAGTVQSRLHYALKRLHAAIGAADGKGTDR
jgi:RNA polymerase sigma-70 factor, ECF subfamily